MNTIKLKIARAFNHAAASYDQHAALQREVGLNLIKLMSTEKISSHLVLDVGAGTGWILPHLKDNFPESMLLSLDFSEKMLPQSESFLCADFDCIPLKNESVDVIYSNLAFQWSLDIEKTFKEIKRVLKKNGKFYFSIFGENTLSEFKESWAATSGTARVNNLHSFEMLQNSLKKQNIKIMESRIEIFKTTHDNFLEAIKSLKYIGANTSLHRENKGLMGKKQFKEIEKHYEQLSGEDNKNSLTYEVYYFSGIKQDE